MPETASSDHDERRTTSKVLVVNSQFPSHGGSRIEKFVKYLPSFGFEPVVLSAKETQSDNSRAILQSHFPASLQTIEAGSIGWSYFSERFLDRGRGAKHYNLLKVLSFPERLILFPDRMVRWIPLGIRAAYRLVEQQGIDVVMTSSPTESTHLIGLALKRRYGIKWVVDLRDLWTTKKIAYRPATKMHDRWTQRLERKIMARADHIIANTPENMRHYVRHFGISKEQVSMIPNGFDREDFIGPCPLKKKSKVFHIGYMGNLDKHDFPWQQFFRLLKRLAEEVGPDNVRFVQCGYHSDEVKRYVTEHSMQQYVVDYGMLPNDQAVQLIAGTDLRLLLLYETEYSGSIVPAKLYNYLNMQGPIFALAPESGAVADILAATGTGVVVSPRRKDAEAYQLLYQLYQDWQQNKSSVDVNIAEVSKYDRKVHAAALARILSTIPTAVDRRNTTG